MVARDDDREIQSQFCEMKFELYWLAQMALTRQLNIPGFLGSFVTQRPFLFFFHLSRPMNQWKMRWKLDCAPKQLPIFDPKVVSWNVVVEGST